MSYDKERPPSDDGINEPQRETRGLWSRKFLLMGTVSVIGALGILYAVAGVTTEVEREEEKGLMAARPPNYNPPEPIATASTKPENSEKETRTETAREEQTEERRKRKRHERRVEESVLAFGNKYMEPITSGLLNGTGAVQVADTGGATGGHIGNTGNGTVMVPGGGQGSAGRGSQKLDFYQGGGGRRNMGLYHPYTMQPELDGCVVKAGDEILVQNPNPVRTELPGRVRGVVIEPVYGKRFLGNGDFVECLAVPPGSTTLSEVNATGVSRGDVRVQMCATRIDMRGGGIMPLDCSPALGQDGSSGVEAEADYAWSGIATGILLEATLGSITGLGRRIGGDVAGIFVDIGSRGVRSVGSDYIDRELMRPPVLTMNPGAIYRIQVNSDISFSEE